jgi:Lrp/AsnC family transcriptional regulator, leucine-responsive regulatory protein
MLDAKSRRILELLQQNARRSNADVAREVGMAPSAVLERIRKLERSRVIVAYEARLDPRRLGLGITAFILVRSEEPVGSHEGGGRLSRLSDVQEVHYLAGEFHYWLKVHVADTDGLARLLKQIGAIPGVRDTRTTLVLSTIKETLALPLEPEVTSETTRRPRKKRG